MKRNDLTDIQKEYVQHLQDTVNSWAKTNVPNEYNYNSRMTYWGSAFTAGIITRDDYDLARVYFGPIWDYVGD